MKEVDFTTDEQKQELLLLLGELMEAYPTWRIGQMVANIAFLGRQSKTATWDITNEEFIETAKTHLELVRKRRDEEDHRLIAEEREQVAA